MRSGDLHDCTPTDFFGVDQDDREERCRERQCCAGPSALSGSSQLSLLRDFRVRGLGVHGLLAGLPLIALTAFPATNVGRSGEA